MPKAGRPPKKPSDRRSAFVAARVTPETLREIERLAEKREWPRSFTAARLIEEGLRTDFARAS